ncbi:MAG: type I-G CRISPR-associated protein Csb2 [Candidatus Tyrphobacter sp.]
MIALGIEFLAGRFHANPWDRGTNDGDVDWPPAPWRLLRAITAGWYRSGRPDRATFISLLDRIAIPPVYRLPQASAGHTRHYMPLGTMKNRNQETTLVLDSFLALDRDHGAAAYAFWPRVDLTPEQHSVLEQCCALVGYLGRAESWCLMHVTETVPGDDGRELVDLASNTRGDGPTVRRLAAGELLHGEALLRSLSETTAEMRKARRLMPVGAVWVEYRLPPDFLMVREQYEREERVHPVFGPTLLRFALDRGKRTPRPSIKDAILFAERLRSAAIERLSKKEGEPATLRLAGKAGDGTPNEGHGHPYFLAFDAEGRGEIDGIDVWFPSGCTHPEYRAVTSITMLYERAFYGDDFPVTFIGAIERPRAHSWQSATPILLDRFPKLRGTNGSRRIIDAPGEQISAMVQRATGQVARVEVWPPGRGIERRRGGHLRVDAFRRTRPHKRLPPLPIAAATLYFDEPVEGPIALGRLAHFGLGKFEPAEGDLEAISPRPT